MNILKKTGKQIAKTFELLCAARMEALRGVRTK